MSNIELFGKAGMRVEGVGAACESVGGDVVSARPLCPGVEGVEELFELFGSGLVIAPLIEDSLVHHHATCRLVTGSEIVVQVSQPSSDRLNLLEVGRDGAENLFCGRQMTATSPAVSSIGVVEATPGLGYRAASISRSALGRHEGRSIRFVLGWSRDTAGCGTCRPVHGARAGWCGDGDAAL